MNDEIMDTMLDKLTELRDKIAFMRIELEAKDTEITELKETIDMKNLNIDGLLQELEDLEEQVNA